MFSITGEQDHTPFGADGVQLVWGQRPDGSHVHISEVPSGLKCDCICPACGLRLAAHKGRKLAHNFHHVNGQACAGARETNAHVWAKKVLEARKEIWIPAGVATAGKERMPAFPAQLFKFDDAWLEKREGSIVPDVVLKAGERELIVEIRVTHPCDDIKIAKIRQQGTSALEIDLSGADSERAVRSRSRDAIPEMARGEKARARTPDSACEAAFDRGGDREDRAAGRGDPAASRAGRWTSLKWRWPPCDLGAPCRESGQRASARRQRLLHLAAIE